jgi:hypothetical protein
LSKYFIARVPERGLAPPVEVKMVNGVPLLSCDGVLYVLIGEDIFRVIGRRGHITNPDFVIGGENVNRTRRNDLGPNRGLHLYILAKYIAPRAAEG